MSAPLSTFGGGPSISRGGAQGRASGPSTAAALVGVRRGY